MGTRDNIFCSKIWLIILIHIWKLLNSWADKSQGCVCGYLLVLYFLQKYKNSYTNNLQTWVLEVREHKSLPLSTPIKNLSSSNLKNSATATPLFSSPQIFLTPRLLECWVLCLSEEWDTDQIILLVSTCFSKMLDSFWLSLSSILSSHR